METQEEHTTDVIPDELPAGDAPSRPKLINGVRICRLVLVVAAIALGGFAIADSKPFYGILAFGCIVAMTVKVRNVRSILAAFAAAEGMYFIANLFSPEGGAARDNILLAAGAALVTVAIARLRHWESSDGSSLHPWLQTAAITFGLLLFINVALVVTSPISSSQYADATTDSVCGNMLQQRAFTTAWTGVLVPSLRHDCRSARGDRVAFGFIQLEVAIGLMLVARTGLGRQPKRVYIWTVVLIVAAASVGQLWADATVSNARRHDAAFQPWYNTYSNDFGQMTLANASLSKALRSGDNNDIITACTQLETIDDALAPSVDAWPKADSADKDQWKKFLGQHRADATHCIQASMGANSETHRADWFADSAVTLNGLRHSISYW